MKLRISNNKNYAVEFDANDIEMFREQGLSALRSFRIATERRVHRGEIHKTVSWFESGTVHFQDDDKIWLNPGIQKRLDSLESFPGLITFEAHPIEVPFVEADSWQDAAHQDEIWFLASLETNWSMFVDAFNYARDLSAVVMGTMDQIDRENNRDSNG